IEQITNTLIIRDNEKKQLANDNVGLTEQNKSLTSRLNQLDQENRRLAGELDQSKRLENKINQENKALALQLSQTQQTVSKISQDKSVEDKDFAAAKSELKDTKGILVQVEQALVVQQNKIDELTRANQTLSQ